ncbi:MAG: mechanosensitive ion channel family protein [Flavobacteriaceae bacterium]
MARLWELFNYQINFGSSVQLTPKGILAIILAFFLTRILLKLLRRILVKTLPEDAKIRFKSLFVFINSFVYLVLILVTLDNIGIEITTIFAASAALLVGVGLALQSFIQDIISGVFMIGDQAIHVGDIIEVEGQVGKVKQITLRTTRAVTRDNKVLIIPNHKFLTSVLYNWTENGDLTQEIISIGVAYNSPVDRVKNILAQVCQDHPKVLKFPEPRVLLENFGDNALEFKVFFSIRESFQANAIKSDIRYAIVEAFGREKIEIPFPQRVVTFVNKPKA